MKNIFLLICTLLLFTTCKKEEEYTTLIVTAESPYFRHNSTIFRGLIFAPNNNVYIREHGFQIRETGPNAYPPYLDTMINLGPRNSQGHFQVELFNLDPGTDYEYYVYALDNNGRWYSSKEHLVNAQGNTLSVSLETPYLTQNSATLKALISSGSSTINLIDHGFRIMETGFNAYPPYLDTIISLGYRNYAGPFQLELFNLLVPGTDYKYYAYATDKDGMYSSMEGIINIQGNTLTVKTETPYLTEGSCTFRALISSGSPNINLIDHGFRIIEPENPYGDPPFLDTIISLGPRNYGGPFETELFFLDPWTDYKYYAFVVNSDNQTYTSAEDSVYTLGMP